MNGKPNTTPIGRDILNRLSATDTTQKKFCEDNGVLRATLNGLITGKVKKLNSKHIQFLEKGFKTDEGYWDKYKVHNNGMEDEDKLDQATLMAKFAIESGYQMFVEPKTGAPCWLPRDATEAEITKAMAGLRTYADSFSLEND